MTHWATGPVTVTDTADLVVIGGGLAGLSLASRLAHGRYDGRVVIVEPRAEYVDDRSWAFWTPAVRLPLAVPSRRWSHWGFSRQDGAQVTCSAEGWHYAFVRALDVYREALKAIASRPTMSLALGTQAVAVGRRGGQLAVTTDAGELTARYVIDTRPPTADRFSRSTLFQCFAGREVRFDQPRFDDTCVELMTDMRADALGFVFTYVLPLSPTQALVESTRFSTRAMSQVEMAADLDQLLARRGLSEGEVLRSEGAVLPMGLPAPDNADAIKGVVRAGQGAGALRAASGFGFLRIQAWAERCAHALLQGQPPIGHSAEPRFRGWMDEVFLRALARHPARSPEFFMRLAASVPGDAFVRFMSDQGRWLDHARIVSALPPGPFLQALHAPASRARSSA